MGVSRISDWLYTWWGWVVSLPRKEACEVITAYNKIMLGIEGPVECVEFPLLGPGISCEVLFFEALRSGSSIRAAVSKLSSQMAGEVPAEERAGFETYVVRLVVRRIGSLLAELEQRLRNEMRTEGCDTPKICMEGDSVVVG